MVSSPCFQTTFQSRKGGRQSVRIRNGARVNGTRNGRA